MKDVIIVGSGIAGASLAWHWTLKGKSVLLVSDVQKGSSAVAAGVYNPTILKRFTSVWKAQEQMQSLEQFYSEIERKTQVQLLHPISILRRLNDHREPTTWTKKAQKPDLAPYMVAVPKELDIPGIEAPYGYGQVSHTGWVDTLALMKATIEAFTNTQDFIQESFDFEQFESNAGFVRYKDWEAKDIIFAEGVQMRNNPFFKDLPLQGNKGEVLTIKVPGLQLDYIIKSSVFLMPYKADLFWVGATYNREDLIDQPTQTGKEFLTSRLERFLKLPYSIVDHKSGIRPTTSDRRPFVGTHPNHPHVHIFNGMGSRAVLMAPWAAQQFYTALYENASLDPELNITRWYS